jgi:hypothetical protein
MKPMNRAVPMPELVAPIRQRGAVVKVLLRARSFNASDHAGHDRAHLLSGSHVFGPFPAYLDTGASVTVLDPGATGALGLEPVAAAGLHVLGRDTVSHHGVYSVEVALAGAAGAVWLPLEVLEGPVNALGRDFLAHFVLTYDGPAGRICLRW